MRFFKDLAFALPILLGSTLVQGGAIVSRAVLRGGTISQPTSGATLTPGQEFTFQYLRTNFCNTGYSKISVYLLATQPTASDVTTSGTIDNPLFSFGDFLYANFGQYLIITSTLITN